MNLALLKPAIQHFINEHLHDDLTTLLLKYKEVDGIPFAEIIEQLEAKARCKKKLPTWFSAKNIYFPNKLNIEQTSSEQTANYKASLLKGNSIIDVTGGFGVDCHAFSKQFKEVTHCEIAEKLSNIVSHNYKSLGIKNIKTVNADGIEYLQNTQQTYDCMYIDPSRRNDVKGKVFLLEDCLPDVVTHQETLFTYATNILIKTSPLLDITNGLRSLQHVKEVHVVAVHNEVKELLWLLTKKTTSVDVCIRTVNLKKQETETFDFYLSKEKEESINVSLPKKYLYEPNAAVLKAGGFLSIAAMYKLEKLHQHSHLYTSNELISFPGRCFTVEKVLPYTKKIIKKELNLKKANITTRNFPESVATIRKKLTIADGGTDFLFLTTVFTEKKVVIHCKKA
ncbi:THUMP-like domain-containing protein [Kordia sp.]|uniref:THUMP-like domain-containing protein n=1 Tax=Kordia sp. TaxID=1965332 RepID=UPI003D2BC14A